MKTLAISLLLLTTLASAQNRIYTTNFPGTENPVSEGSNWVNGSSAGNSTGTCNGHTCYIWANVRSSAGKAFGTEQTDTTAGSSFRDGTALVNGTWGAAQCAQATVYTTAGVPAVGSPNFPEVELRLRSSLSANTNSGYEIDVAVDSTGTSGSAYAAVVRWNGAYGSFTYINPAGGNVSGAQYGVKNGDVIKACIDATTNITVYKNGTLVPALSSSDATFPSGKPGIGFNAEVSGTNDSTYGFSSFTASDGLSSAGILAPSRAINWANAGLPNVLPDGETTANAWTPPVRTQCGSTVANGASLATINGLIAACASGTYLLLGPGTFSGGFTFKNNVTVRGSGANSTFLTSGFQIGNGGDGGWAQLTAAPAKDAGSFIVTGTQPPTNAQVWLQQCDTNTSAANGSFVIFGNSVCSGTHADNGDLYICGLDTQCDRNGGGTSDPHFQAQVGFIPVGGVTGTGPYTVNFSNPVYMPNWSTARTVTLAWGNQAQFAQGVGVEDLSIAGVVSFVEAYASWVKGVRIVTAGDAGNGETVRTQRSNHILFANNYVYANDKVASFTNDRPAITHGDGFGDYPVSDILYLNNILQEGMFEGIGPSENVIFGYNYIRDAQAGNSTNATANYSEGEFQHHAGTAFLLREGNQQATSMDDATWGTHTLNTWFRNYYSCYDGPFTVANSLKAIEIGQYARFENIIGNALGNSAPACALASVYAFPAGDATGLTSASLMRWGNCDTVSCKFLPGDVPTSLSSFNATAQTFQNTVPASNNLPASFFMPGSSAPTWWRTCTSWGTFPTSCVSTSSIPFPAIGPDVAGGQYLNGKANDIPATVAWKNLPIDASNQNSYTVTGSSWSGGTETLNAAIPGGEHLMGGFQLTGAPAACSPTSGVSYTGRGDGEILMTNSASGTSISYALAVNPGVACTGTAKWPDVRQFDERVFGATAGAATAPTVTTTTATSITTTTASSGGTVTSDGGASVTSEGVCYATTVNPTTPCTSNGTATPFTSAISGLTANTLYHYRAFATNSVGTSFGSDLTFTTLNSTFSISGTVSPAAGSTDPNPNVTISCPTCAFTTVQTSAGGAYSIAGNPNGTYTLTPSKTGYTFSPANIVATVSGANNTGNAFTATGTTTVTLTPSTWNFGSQGIGTSSAGKDFTLSNTGTGQLTSIVISDTGGNTADFSQTTTCGSALNAATSCTITATFTPSASGARSTTLQVADSLGTQTAALSGTGFQPPVPSCTPTGGSYKSGRMVSCSNAVPSATTCWRVGTPPTTDGAGTCTTGTTYVAPFMVTTTGTLFVTGTQSGNTDNSVSYVFTITPTWTTGWVMNLGSGRTQMGGTIAAPVFSARTDNCATGAQTGCIGGAITGQAGSALSFRGLDSDALPFSQLAPANTAWTDPDFNSYAVLATDTAVATQAGFSGGAIFSVGEGGSFWAKDNSMFTVVNTGGVTLLLYVNTALVHSKGCSPATPCVLYTGIKSSATQDSTHFSSSIAFSKIPSDSANTLFEVSTDHTQVSKITVNGLPGCATTHNCTLTRTLYVDFTSNTPVNCSVIPVDYHSANAWIGLFTPTADGTVGYATGGAGIWHAATAYTFPDSFILPSTNNAGNFAFQATVSGTSAPVTEPTWCQSTGCTVSDNGVTWTNIGTIGGQGPGFDLLIYNPNASSGVQGCRHINTRIGKVYNGVGVSAPAGTLTTDSPSSCWNLYGSLATPCAFTDIGTLHGAQTTPSAAFIQWSPTGGGAAPSSPFTGKQSCRSNTGAENYCYNFIWQTNSNIVRACNQYTNQGSGAVYGKCDGHGIVGYGQRWAAGAFYSHNYAGMNDATGAASPGTALLTTTVPWDLHSSYNASAAGDLLPILIAYSDVPSQGRLAGTGPTLAWYNEVVYVKTDGSGTAYRITHNWNTGSSPSFGVQNAFGVTSPDNTFMSVATDMMGSRGSVTAPASACSKLRGDLGWTASTSFANGIRVLPVVNNTNQSIFENQGATGNSGSSQPNFNNCSTLSSTCADGGVTWTNIGINNCRGDVFIVDVSSAH